MKVLYIGGMDRSGSTLLGRLLGNVSGCINLAEADVIWERWNSRSVRCGCGAIFAECGFWGAVRRQVFESDGNEIIDAVVQFRSQSRRWGRTDESNRESSAAMTAADYRRYLGKVYAAVSELSGAALIIDTSKRISYARSLAAAPGVDLRFLHLIRDSRAVAFSQQRRKRNPGFVDQNTYMSPTSWTKSARQWNAVNAALPLGCPGNRSMRMRYEDLVIDPLNALTQIFEFLDEPVPPLEFLHRQPLHLGREHTVSGNPDRFNPEIIIRPDMEWREKMPVGAKAFVTAATFPLLAFYGYLQSPNPRK
ncbi:sulfotransferase [Capsulimonas corticalis]|uniref:Sulfotransferase n=1 Tax=Capsulimonas corticalis TaxID=2219043 RepID=A0A402CQV7_9BACT|nr:sulfotransferase [Capsulimonas corticalis]BDI32626.1 sulfotransferase [Capsulimonas corticalis]